ncbi:hypothetical protein [Nocardia sp. NPDC052112]|uniref:hypothetical protein n=1 Tax=Nocardia sp. NPDC052112 TaxID=3155646 RepID=UPI0034210F40
MFDNLNVPSIEFEGSGGLVECLVRGLESVPRKSGGRPLVLCIGGYPFMGKTLLSHRVVSAWRGPAYALATESAIMTRHDRLIKQLDGSSAEAHEIDKLMATITSVSDGASDTVVDMYSWSLGCFDGVQQVPALQGDGLLIVDGSISTAPPILDIADVAIALEPADYTQWLASAVERDISVRNWDRAEAELQNRAKAHSVVAQLAHFGRKATEHRVQVSFQHDRQWLVRATSV